MTPIRQLLKLTVELERERKQLLRWKEDQLKVEASWNPQDVGKALDLSPAAPIRSSILPAIKKLQKKNSDLRKLAEEVAFHTYSEQDSARLRAMAKDLIKESD